MRMLSPYETSRSFAADLINEIDRFFDDIGHETRNEIYDERSFSPGYEVAESDDHYIMSIDLPGMKKDDIKIEIADDLLTISGERKRETSSNERQKIQLQLKPYGSFKRSFSLPSSVDSSKAEARYEDGVLELQLPKTQTAKPRQIEIQ